MRPGTVAKAIIAFVIAGGGASQTALLDGVVSPAEWVAIAVTAIVAGATVYTTPNEQDTNARHRAPTP